MKNRKLKLSISETVCNEDYDKRQLKLVLQMLTIGGKVESAYYKFDEDKNLYRYFFDIVVFKKRYLVNIKIFENENKIMIYSEKYWEENDTKFDISKVISKVKLKDFEVTFKHEPYIYEIPKKTYKERKKKYPYGSFEEKRRRIIKGYPSKVKSYSKIKLEKIYLQNSKKVDSKIFKLFGYYLKGEDFKNKILRQVTLESWICEANYHLDFSNVLKKQELNQTLNLAKKVVRVGSKLQESLPFKTIQKTANPNQYRVANARFIAKQNIKNYLETDLKGDIEFYKSL